MKFVLIRVHSWFSSVLKGIHEAYFPAFSFPRLGYLRFRVWRIRWLLNCDWSGLCIEPGSDAEMFKRLVFGPVSLDILQDAPNVVVRLTKLHGRRR